MNKEMKELKKAALAAGKKLVFNRSTGEYQIISAFVASCGEIPFYDEKGKKFLSDSQIKILRSYI